MNNKDNEHQELINELINKNNKFKTEKEKLLNDNNYLMLNNNNDNEFSKSLNELSKIKRYAHIMGFNIKTIQNILSNN